MTFTAAERRAAAIAAGQNIAATLAAYDAQEEAASTITLDSSTWIITESAHPVHTCADCAEAGRSAAIHARAMGSSGGTWQVGDGETIAHSAKVKRTAA